LLYEIYANVTIFVSRFGWVFFKVKNNVYVNRNAFTVKRKNKIV